MINLDYCPICKSGNITKFHETGYAPKVSHEIIPGIFIDALVVTNYFKCLNCNIIFQNPRMKDVELAKFYNQGFYRKVINLTDKEKDADEKARAETDAKIINGKIGKIKSHLDLGCSRGYLLNKIGAKNKHGIDEDIKNIRFPNINKHRNFNSLGNKKFDLITIIHTLEHVSDPLKLLTKMVSYLNSDGYLVIEVPTWKSPGGPLRLPHLYHFEPDVLRLICKQVGLKIVNAEFTPHLLLICKLNT